MYPLGGMIAGESPKPTGPDHPGATAALALLARAVSGRDVDVAESSEERAYTDGETIYIPAGAGRGANVDTVIVQAALLANGALDPRVARRLMANRRARGRYVTLEAARAGVDLDHVLPGPLSRRLAALHEGPRPADASESLEAALAGRPLQAPEWLGEIRPGRISRDTVGAGAPSGRDRSGDPRQGDMRELEDDEEEDGERSRIMDLFRAPGPQNPLIAQFQKLLGAGRSKTESEDGASGEEVPVAGQRVGRVGKAAKRIADRVRLSFEAPNRGGVTYPEWSAEARTYREDWCTVTTYNPRRDPDAEVGAQAKDRRLLKALASLGLAQRRHRREPEGEGLDLTSLIDFAVDRRTGLSPDPRVYEQRRKTGHDLGVLILLDASGSTGETDAQTTVFADQQELAERMITAFEQLDDRVAAYGFQSWGRHSVNYLRIKGFDDRHDTAARQRLWSLEPMGFTRLGAAIRHGSRLLSDDAGTPHRLLIVVGDGLPFDDGYEQAYAQADSRRALEEAIAAGVACACVSIRSSTEPEMIERVWGHVPHAELERPGDLPGEARALFGRAMTEAAATRRRIAGQSDRCREPQTRKEKMNSRLQRLTATNS